MRNTERLYDRVIEKMDMTCDMEDEELQELIHEVLEEASKEEFIPLQEKIRISKELFNAFRKLDILQELIEDDEITEIMINGTDHIFLEVPEVFAPQPLIYKVKREQPASKKQKEVLRELLKYHRINLSAQIDSLSKNEISRLTDQIIAQHGRMQKRCEICLNFQIRKHARSYQRLLL